MGNIFSETSKTDKEQIAELKSNYEELLNYVRCLKLSDLQDVSGCLQPNLGDVLTYTGRIWNASPLPELNNIDLQIIPEYTEGTLLATIIKNGERNFIYNPESPTDIQVTPYENSGNKIATITVGNVSKDLYTGEISGSGTLDNIEVNSISGEVENKIAKVTVTGADINVTGFNPTVDQHNNPQDWQNQNWYNDELKIQETDTVNDALSKLQQALLDDEFVCNRAFYALQKSTGFDNNLSYQGVTGVGTGESELFYPINRDNNSGSRNVTNAIQLLVQNLYSTMTTLNKIKNRSLTIQGVSVTSGSNTFKLIPWEDDISTQRENHTLVIPPTAFINVTMYPGLVNSTNGKFFTILKPTDSGFDANTMISVLDTSDQATVSVYTTLKSIVKSGTMITFQTGNADSSRGTWETYQYIGPSTYNQEIVVLDWGNSSNWVLVHSTP